MDQEFLEKIIPTFLCLTTAILCHALGCWQMGSLLMRFTSHILIREVSHY